MKAASITHFPGVTASELAEALGRIVGPEHIHLDETRRRLHSEDIWQQAAAVVALVAAPASTEETAQVVRLVHESGFAIAPRGAGMSYTGGYVPAGERTVSLDMSRMNRILRVSRDDMVVSVQAGVTWKALGDALAPLGLRTPFWGPMSGLKSTIGRRDVAAQRDVRRRPARHLEREPGSAVGGSGRWPCAAHRRTRCGRRYAFLSSFRSRSCRPVLRRLRRVRCEDRDYPAADRNPRA